MEDSERGDFLSNLVFSNEVILDKIFSDIPTQELHLSVNRVNRLWKDVAVKMVHLNRKIFLNNANIFAYCELIKSGGESHRNIKLDLNCSEDQPLLSPDQVDTLISTYWKIGEFVQELSLHASLWDNDSAKQCQSNLFHHIILKSPNIVEFSFRTPGLYGVDPEQLFYSEDSNLANLKILTLESLEYSDRMKLMISFLSHSPKIQQINWGPGETISFKMEDLFRLEQLAPKFFQNLCSLTFEKLDEEMGNFLVSTDFRELRKLNITVGLEVSALAKVLEKYGGQLIHLGLALGEIWKNQEYVGIQNWEFPIIQFPVMRNLENLDLSYFGLQGNNPKYPILRFWDCESSRVFRALHFFTVFFGPELEQHQIEAVMSQTFRFSPVHPIFPNVVYISGSVMGDIKRANAYLNDMIASYFPNLVVHATAQPFPSLFLWGRSFGDGSEV